MWSYNTVNFPYSEPMMFGMRMPSIKIVRITRKEYEIEKEWRESKVYLALYGDNNE